MFYLFKKIRMEKFAGIWEKAREKMEKSEEHGKNI